MIKAIRDLLTIFFVFFLHLSFAQEANYILGPNDVIKISVFNNPDLTLEARITEAGLISFPLIGEVSVGGVTTFVAEKRIADALDKKGFIKKPQVNILVLQFQSKLVSVLGSVLKPGRYPLERETSLSDLLAQAGGLSPDGSDLISVTDKAGKKTEYDLSSVNEAGSKAQNLKLVGGETVFVDSKNVSVMGQVNRPGKYSIVSGVRTVADFLTMAGGVNQVGSDTVTVTTVQDGKTHRFEVDVDDLFRTGNESANIDLRSGDSVYVPRAPMVYIYGEVNRPGSFKIERNMTVMQVISQGGGITVRGTERNIKLNRKNAKGEVSTIHPKLTDPVQQDDVLYVQESLF